MPSSLTWFLSRTLVCSTHPPVSVCGTGRCDPTLGDFSRLPKNRVQLPKEHPLARPPQPTGGPAFRTRHRHHSRTGRRNIRLLSIDYAFRPRLRSRLTLGGRTWPRNPWIYGGRDSHPPFRYSCLHGHSDTLHRPSQGGFTAESDALLPNIINYKSTASAARLSPDHFRRRVSRPVSCYAIFKWWLPLSQHPGCH